MKLWTFEPVVRKVKCADGTYDEFVDITLAGGTVWTDERPSRSCSTDYEPDTEHSMRLFAGRLSEVLNREELT